jgi:hypothetical protein
MISLADYLKQPLDTVLKMSMLEFQLWMAHIKQKNKQQQKDVAKAKRR